jgi:hypothetical protein
MMGWQTGDECGIHSRPSKASNLAINQSPAALVGDFINGIGH